jgi:hypothetical protein
MHKFPIPIAHELPADHRRAKIARALALVMLGLFLAPLIADGAALCANQWREVLGKNGQTKTPVLDSVADAVETGHRSLWESIDLYFHRLPWDPRIVLTVGAIVMVLAMVMLRL